MITIYNNFSGENFKKLLYKSKIPLSSISKKTGISRSKFYRIFDEVTELSYSEVLSLCEILDVTELEFRYIVSSNKDTYSYIAKYKYFEKNRGQGSKEEIEEVMQYFSKNKFNSLSHFLLWMRCTMFLYSQIVPYAGLKENDLSFVMRKINAKQHVGAVDYFVLAAIVPELPYEFLKTFYKKFLPVEKEYLVSVSLEERTAVREFTSNLFDKAFENEDYEFANELNDDLAAILLYYPSLRFELLLKCRENYISLKNKFDRNKIKEIEIYIEALEKIGDISFSQGLALELNSIFGQSMYQIPEGKMLGE